MKTLAVLRAEGEGEDRLLGWGAAGQPADGGLRF